MDLSGVKETISGILEKIRGIPGKTGEFFAGFNLTPEINKDIFGKIKETFSGFVPRIKETIDHVEENKRKPLFIGFGALAVFFLTLIIAFGVLSSRKRKVISPDAAAAGVSISVEDMFIPPEPDFLPEFIFEREKRRFWSLEDIRQYWKVPDSSDRWREEIKSAVDKLMEGIQ